MCIANVDFASKECYLEFSSILQWGHIGFVCYKIDYFSPLQDLRDLNKNILVFLHL